MGGGDKHGPKSGRYVGGFLQLFDWNAKSRKKLFSSKSDLPEESKQGKKALESLPSTRIHVQDEDEEFGAYGARLSARGGSDYSCASSVTSDGFGTKAPGVVARLMGLDSLPTSNEMDPFSTPFFDSISLQDGLFRGRNNDFYHDHLITHSTRPYGKIESMSGNVELESRSLKLPNRPIEKFQTEVLPPKSAKTIPITHHKLLSPIKSPIFVPSQDAAHIMEAAAKIIEPGPSANPRAKISSSVPFKVRELREKLEASQRPAKGSEQLKRPIDSNAAKCLRGQSMQKSWNNGLGESTLYRASPNREDNKGKSISLAVQAKVNVQQRERLTSSSKFVGDLEEKEDKRSTQLSRKHASAPKFSNRKPLNQSNTSVLRQNNQKQNCPSSHRERSVLKGSVTTSTSKKSTSEDTSNSQPKSIARDSGTTSRTMRKSSLHSKNSNKGVSYGGGNNVPRKKRSIDGNFHHNKNQVTEKSSHSSGVGDKQLTWIEESRRKGLDVVSFTFTAPITRSQPGFCPSGQLGSEDGSKIIGDSNLTRISSPGLNGIRGDALSKLLEQKLKELASNLESRDDSYEKLELARERMTPGSAESAIRKPREKLFQQEPLVLDVNSPTNFQAGEADDEYNGSKAEAKKRNDLHSPSPVSILEPSVLDESCCSSESIASSITEESKLCSSVQSQEVINSSSCSLHHTEISDSASSTSSQITNQKVSMKSTAWELGYIKDILSNVELMFKDYVAGRTREILNPHLFDQMEKRIGAGQDELKLERKLLFDCVGECLDLKCQSYVCGGFDMWSKGINTLKRKERLAEEVYKEIQVWRNLGNSMVDELVDQDMSSKYGKWLDFQVDEFVLGVEIEGQILDSLVEEIVFDIVYKQ